MWGRSNSAAVLEAELNLLRQENARLIEQNRSLQEALIAAASPMAYQQQVAARLAAQDAADPEKTEAKNEERFMDRYLREMEGSTFRSADEFVNFLSKGPTLQDKLETAVTRPPQMTGSLHGNSES